jgi:carbamoyltransferase
VTAILGINAFHADSAACLVTDGVLAGAVAEERLGDRLKHSPRFPANAIRGLLEDAGLRLKDLTHVAVARDPSANHPAKARYVLGRPLQAAGAVVEHLRRNNRTHGALPVHRLR